MSSLLDPLAAVARRGRAAAVARAREKGTRPPRAYWLARYGPERALSYTPFGPVARRARDTSGGVPRLPPSAQHGLPAPTRNVIFYAINGSGLGHLTRCLAIARHLTDVTPIIITTCTRASVAEPYGIT